MANLLLRSQDYQISTDFDAKARLYLKLLGGIDGNIALITNTNNQIFITVKDLSWFDPFNVILELGICIISIKIIDHLIILECAQATKLIRKMIRIKMLVKHEVMSHF
ncbi:hypothetical protein [Xylocopilactobacillus apicola]|uniref:Uncharacterized protein n=1 Tax=Xylocopilactobacillus apicola TaxID=2932184 RepID=A0AAU9DAQ1_9LACO|nr:hypothetical protein [Xylocopilactobacillus apicola]BDR57902.1 hypothetical protein XA3_03430 [Xylocopilactobacillus apicola]